MKTSPPSPSAANPRRVDRWLWTIRACKTRALATAACRSGRVRVDDAVVKPARELHIGETVTLRIGPELKRWTVRDFPASRVGAKGVADFAEDHTPPPPPQSAAAMAPGGPRFTRQPGSGRPTKRDRRKLLDMLDTP